MAFALFVATLTLVALPSAASAWQVTVSVHGAGSLDETTPRNLLNCSVSPSGTSELSENTCVAGTPTGGYQHGDIIELEATVPSASTAHARGWRFLKWVDGNGGGRINCDPQPTVGDHFSATCRFQIFENLEVDVYFDDTAGPTSTTVTSGPTDSINQSSATFSFDDTTDPDATFQCRLDRPGGIVGAWSVCGGPSQKSQGYTGLTTNGGYTFWVRSLDPSGNVGDDASRSFVVDTVAPALSLSGSPAHGSVTKQTTAAFIVSTNEGTLTCTLDGAPKACGGTHGALNDGPHTFVARATDAAGNQATASRTWTVDATAPVVSLAGGPAAGTTVASSEATFTATTNEGTLSCALDGAPVGCGATHTGLTDGPHTFVATATDTAGNEDSESRTWTVDTTGPDTLIAGTPAADTSTTSTSAEFTLSSPESGVTYECSLDGAAFAACPDVWSLSGLALGDHVAAVRAVDALGNRDATPAERRWRIVAPAADPPSNNDAPGPGSGPPGGTGGDPAAPGGGPTGAAPNAPGIIKARFVRLGGRTRVIALALRGLAPGSRARLTCAGTGCKTKRQALTSPASGRLVLLGLLKTRTVPAGVTLSVRITAPGHAPRTFRFVTRRGKLPLRL